MTSSYLHLVVISMHFPITGPGKASEMFTSTHCFYADGGLRLCMKNICIRSSIFGGVGVVEGHGILVRIV